MRDFAELIKDLRESAEWSDRLAVLMGRDVGDSKAPLMRKAADAIEELLAFAKFVAREAIDTGDNDGVSAEILCRKLNKLGLIETDGEFWMLPEPPKGVE
jgi:hypothetical protein